MKLTTILAALVFAVSIFISHKTAESKPISANKTAELNTQIVQEIKDVLQVPYLRYASEDLSGKVTVMTKVDNNGKIIFGEINGINEDLKDNVRAKLNSLNLWTSPDYSGKSFQYRINYFD